ncbi:MAG: hypothetical protein JO324_01655 [Candidatus Eremiobacteraeota bacterium]|nr:hypothetical protein [Candidatus Eremiobacteraeota bacterium]MBV9262996.1 hypothetical protein [Candidatus Eremiobacteraeota bacterium]
MRAYLGSMSAMAAAAMIAGCAGSTPLAPETARLTSTAAMPAKAPTRGLYVANAFAILGYAGKHFRKPYCQIAGEYGGIATDASRNLIAPIPGAQSVEIFRGPALCGSPVATIAEPYGQPSVAAANDALHGPIAVGNLTDSSGVGSVTVCTVKSGCTRNLTSPAITGYGGGVAMDNGGNCWLTSENATFTASIMTYWPKCNGSGKTAKGYKNASYGTLAIDGDGNIVAVDFANPSAGSEIWVYRGCAPRCKLVGGPYRLHGNTLFISLNKEAGLLAGVDYGSGAIDVYSYGPTTGVKYLYSFTSSPSGSETGIAWVPRSEQ